MEVAKYGGGLTSLQWRHSIEYGGGCSVRWRANISTVEAVQYGGGLALVQWRLYIVLILRGSRGSKENLGNLIQSPYY